MPIPVAKQTAATHSDTSTRLTLRNEFGQLPEFVRVMAEFADVIMTDLDALDSREHQLDAKSDEERKHSGGDFAARHHDE